MLRGGEAALFADFYELTMAASYFRHGFVEPATFELVVRALPSRRNYLIAAGLEEALDYLEKLHFDAPALEYLASLGVFDDAFLDHLGTLRFRGDVCAVAEGEAVFADEPIVQITAPLIEAQLIETYLLNCIGFHTMIAAKAARIATACRGRPFYDFSARRDHGTDAAQRVARDAQIAGAAGTSLVLAGRTYGLELSGTMAHSYVLRFGDETAAFDAYAREFPGRATLLIDTFDTEQGARKVVALAPRLRAAGALPAAVRIDSGDLAGLSRSVRRILDDGGLATTKIVASGDLDEYRIAELVDAGAPIDAFGVGTQLGTSGDSPHLGVIYKLVEDSGGPKGKASPGKRTLPGRKQVHRSEAGGRYDHDVLALAGEPAPAGARSLLEPVMTGGRRRAASPSLAELRQRASATFAALPPRLLALDEAEPPYEIRLSDGLRALADHLGTSRVDARGVD